MSRKNLILLVVASVLSAPFAYAENWHLGDILYKGTIGGTGAPILVCVDDDGTTHVWQDKNQQDKQEYLECLEKAIDKLDGENE